MKTTPLHSSPRQHLFQGLLLTICLSLAIRGDVHAAVTITGNSTFNVPTNDYTYTYSVTNTGLTDDLVIVTLPVFSPLGVGSVMAPTGFLLTFDPSQRVVNFIEDGNIVTPQTFAPGSTVGTFSFTSVMAPGTANFLAYDATGTEFTGTAVAPIPEPAAALTGLFAAGALLARRRRA
jgi:hypothetical protein